MRPSWNRTRSRTFQHRPIAFGPRAEEHNSGPSCDRTVRYVAGRVGRHRNLWFALSVLGVGLCFGSCGYSALANEHDRSGREITSQVRVNVTPAGCPPIPSRVSAGAVGITATNVDAPTVSEIEIRSSDLSRVIGEKENLIEGLSQTFSIYLEQGRYMISCPGAVKQYWSLVVSSTATPESR